MDYEYLRRLISLCNNAKAIKQNYDQNAAMSIFENSKTYYQKMAAAVDFSSCQHFAELQRRHSHYISQLVYLR